LGEDYLPIIAKSLRIYPTVCEFTIGGSKARKQVYISRRRGGIMMQWDYRVFFEDGGYTIRTVYYDDEGTIVACSAKPIEPFGESLEELEEELNLLQAAVTKKVLSASDIPTQTVRPKVKRGKSLAAVRQQLGLQSEVVKEGSLTSKD